MNKKVEDHGNFRHGLTEHPLYSIWAGMKYRCKTNRITGEYWHRRGISVFAEWQNFIPFYKWAIKNGYRKGLTLDRINNDGNYEPGNCRFTTYNIQNGNRRKFQSMPRHSGC
ncbi:MAG: hypothetical protein WC261_09970 [Synergistaceae bacterium]|jgi:hypothetical protein